MEIRKATLDDCRAIAELALFAGEGIPAYFWAQSQKEGETIKDVGAQKAASEVNNFSYRNVHLACTGDEIAGMLLAYRLPDATNAEELESVPEFICPLLELEMCAPGTFYVNMVAAYPQFRNQGVGTKLMSIVDSLAQEAGCSTLSVEVFEQNGGALRLYQRLGYNVVEQRDVISHSCHPYTGKILLLTKAVRSSGNDIGHA
jgi:ribosomal protein S18 acetylase RimI-like enzyme